MEPHNRDTHWAEHYVNRHLDRRLPIESDEYSDQRAISVERQFAAALAQYRYSLNASGTPTGDLITNCNDWDEIGAMIEATERSYNRDATWFEKAIRWTGNHAPYFHMWAGLLPTDNNMSILGGGVKLLLFAAEQRSMQVQKMLSALHSTTDIIASAENRLQDFQNDEKLRRSARALYLTMLHLIEACINSLIHEGKWSKVKSAFTGSGEARRLVEPAFSRLEDAQNTFRNTVEDLTLGIIVGTASDTRRIQEDLKKIRPLIMQAKVLGTRTSDSEERDGTELKIKQQLDDHGAILVNLKEMMQGLIDTSEWYKEAEELRSEKSRLQAENLYLGLRSLTPTENLSDTDKKYFLWKIIELDADNYVDDVESLVRGGHTLGSAPAQALSMTQHSRVKKFMNTATSDAIFVETRDEGTNDRRTAMTLACALYLQSLRKSPAATLHYFCGEHNKQTDPVHGGLGIARMLMGQLLSLQSFDLGFLNEDWRTELEQRNSSVFFATLERLMGQVRNSALFCIIDGITLFEHNAWRDDTLTVLSELLRIVGSHEHAPAIKLLITTSSKSRVFGRMFSQIGGDGLVTLGRNVRNDNVSIQKLKVNIAGSTGHSPSRRASASYVSSAQQTDRFQR